MSFLQKYKFKSNLFFSPMEACSDVAIRSLCYEQGAALTYIEMIRAYALTKKKQRFLEKLDPSPNIRQGLQLAAVKVNELKKTLVMIKTKQQEQDPRFMHIETIDLNLGCPSPGLISEGGGSALIKRTNRVKELFETLRSTWEGPVSAKMRLGMTQQEKEKKLYLKILNIAEEIGMDWITVHPKTVKDPSRDPIDLRALQECVENTSTPIIGNGLVTDEASAQTMLKTGIKGIMIARAAVADPFIFKRLKYYEETGKKLAQPTKQEYEQAFKRYLELATQAKIPQYYIEYHTRMFQLKINNQWDHFHSPKTMEQWT
ncbi:MAG: tRNA-dihydrouridine synthase family protein [Candidatus Woesearchaeota archaeon]|nr:tRNA-dihydrouridine synthase family protein [Candidatus Woesearchaeota archaeon]